MAGRRPFGSDGVADYGTLSDPVDNYSGVATCMVCLEIVKVTPVLCEY